ncbi:hypothetical protein Y032_0133g1743, partial [Ancylostoma ceylanicum]
SHFLSLECSYWVDAEEMIPSYRLLCPRQTTATFRNAHKRARKQHVEYADIHLLVYGAAQM